MVSRCFGFTFHAKLFRKKVQAKLLIFTRVSITFCIFTSFSAFQLFSFCRLKTSQKGCNLATVNDKKSIFSLKVAETFVFILTLKTIFGVGVPEN